MHPVMFPVRHKQIIEGGSISMKLRAIAIASGVLFGLSSAQAVPLSSALVLQNQIVTGNAVQKVNYHCRPSSIWCPGLPRYGRTHYRFGSGIRHFRSWRRGR
jgi:hypothetical protein